MTTDIPETVEIAALAKLLGVSTRQVRNLLEDARVKSVARGRWPLAQAIQAILANARKNRDTSELARARTRIIDAKARREETAIAVAERELVPVEEFTATLDVVMRAIVDEIDGGSARVTRDLTVRRRIDAEVMAMRARMASTVVAHAAALRMESPEHSEH